MLRKFTAISLGSKVKYLIETVGEVYILVSEFIMLNFILY